MLPIARLGKISFTKTKKENGDVAGAEVNQEQFYVAQVKMNADGQSGVFQFVKSAKWRVGEEKALKALGAVHEQTGEGGPVVWNKMGEGWSWTRKRLNCCATSSPLHSLRKV